MKDSSPYPFVARIGRLYDFSLWVTGYERLVNKFIGLLPIEQSRPIRVLDAGCGTGLYAFGILKRYPNSQVTAFDLNTGFVKHLEQRLLEEDLNSRTKVFAADAQGPLAELRNERFDAIVTSGVLEYVALEPTIAHLSKFLSPHGYFLYSPVKDTAFGKLVCKIYSCAPYPHERNVQAFLSNGFILKKFYSPKSFKALYIFQKL